MFLHTRPVLNISLVSSSPDVRSSASFVHLHFTLLSSTCRISIPNSADSPCTAIGLLLTVISLRPPFMTLLSLKLRCQLARFYRAMLGGWLACHFGIIMRLGPACLSGHPSRTVARVLRRSTPNLRLEGLLSAPLPRAVGPLEPGAMPGLRETMPFRLPLTERGQGSPSGFSIMQGSGQPQRLLPVVEGPQSAPMATLYSVQRRYRLHDRE